MPRPAPAIRQPLKWAGGKFYLSRWIHSLAPPHTHRVIGYGGGLGELWNWPHAGVSEVVNDLNGYLINFYRVLQSDKLFAEFRRRVAAVPFARVEWTDAHKAMTALIDKTAPAAYRPGTPDVTVALLFFVWNRQSMGGRMDTFSPLTRVRTRGGRNAEANAYWGSVDGLPVVKERFDGVVIEHDDVLRVIDREDAPGMLTYLDPTYVMGTAPGEGRTTADLYHVECDEAHHDALLTRLEAGLEGKVMLSGYPSKMYDRRLTKKKGWRRLEKRIDNKTQKGPVKRQMTEVLWLNYDPPRAAP